MFEKGQISFDFIFAMIVFMVLFSFVLAITKDYNTRFLDIKDHIVNYSTYLDVSDSIMSSRYADLNITHKISFASEKCMLNSIDKNLIIGSEDNNFLIYVGKDFKISNKKCKNYNLKIK